jgi:hypothetical protein
MPPNIPSDNRALTSLNLADNKIGAYYDSDRNKMVATPEGTPCGKSYLSALTFALFAGSAAIANAIKDMGALTKLDIRGNHIPSEQERGLQGIYTAAGIELAI